MFFILFSLSRSFFRFKEYKLYLEKEDDVNIVFTGMKASDSKITFNFDYQKNLCDEINWKKTFSSLGEDIVGIINIETNFKTKFLKNISSKDCICRRVIKNAHKSKIKKMIKNDYILTFKFDKFQLSSLGSMGFKVGYKEVVNNHFIFQIHYKKVTANTYEIIGMSGIAESYFNYKTKEGECIRTIQPFNLPEFNELSFSYEIIFVESQLNIPQTVSFDLFQKKIKKLILINSVFFALWIYFSIKGKKNLQIWKSISVDIYRIPNNMVLLCCLSGAGFQVMFTLFFSSFFTYTSFVDVVEKLFYILPWCGIFNGYISSLISKYLGGCSYISVYKTALVLVPAFLILIYFAKVLIHYSNLSIIIPTLKSLGRIVKLIAINELTVSIGFFIGQNKKCKGHPASTSNELTKIPIMPFYMDYNIKKAVGGIFVFANLWETIDFIYLAIINNYTYESSSIATFYFLLFVCIISSEISIIFTYLQARKGDFRCYWTSFSIPAASSFFYFIYCLYNIKKYKIENAVSICFNILDNSVICGSLYVMCGSIGFISTLLYLSFIYKKRVIIKNNQQIFLN